MKLDRVIAVRNNKTVYRDGEKCVKVFDEKSNNMLLKGFNVEKALEFNYL